MSALYSAAQSRAIDRDAMERQGIAGFALMTRAADAAWQWIRARYPGCSNAVVYAGVGNNAGDGYLAAARMQEAGKAVRVVQLAPDEALQGDARIACEEARRGGVPMQPFAPEQEAAEELVVDALLGTGLSRAPEGDWAAAIGQINRASAPVVAMDIPSGLCADTGVASPATVRADSTATFIARKRGLYTADGPDHAGRIEFCGLDVDAEGFERTQREAGEPVQVELMDWDSVRGGLRPRRRNSHKGQYGHVLVVGGQAGFQGAAELCGGSALRCGSGLVSLAQPPEAVQASGSMPELMRHAVVDRLALQRLAATADIIAIGPGLGQDAWAREMLAAVREMRQPLVVDADALRLLATDPQVRSDWVLTPHPGEAGVLLGGDSRTVQQDRFAAVERMQRQYGGAVVLKGCGTLVADDSGRIGVGAESHPGMATAGVGDVLTGVIASLLGQGIGLAQAARMGVCLHAAAAMQAGRQGRHGMLAGDLLPHLCTLAEPADGRT